MSAPQKPPAAPAPGPYDWEWIGAKASGGGHIYLIDKNRRKIAAIWGGAEEKLETARVLAAGANSVAQGRALAESVLAYLDRGTPTAAPQLIDAAKAFIEAAKEAGL